MKVTKVLVPCALAALVAGCTVQPALPVATVRVPPPVVVSPAAPILVTPAHHAPHPGRGWGHHKHRHHH